MIPKITRPPIFKSTRHLAEFFLQDDVSRLRPLGKIVGFVKKELALEPPKKEEDKKEGADDDIYAWAGIDKGTNTVRFKVMASMPKYELPGNIIR